METYNQYVEKSGLESKLGAYDKVTEFDFALLYPYIVLKKNISSEAINGDCCE